MKELVSKGGIPSGNTPVSKLKQYCLQALNQRLGQPNKANPQRCTIKLISCVWNKYCRGLEKRFPAIVKRRVGV